MNEVNKATYLELLKLDLSLDPVIRIKSAPTEGNKIKEDKIGKFIYVIIKYVRKAEKPSSIINAYWYI